MQRILAELDALLRRGESAALCTDAAIAGSSGRVATRSESTTAERLMRWFDAAVATVATSPSLG
jgi:hypothetical protein